MSDGASAPRRSRRTSLRVANRGLALIGLLLGSIVVAPQLLAFPHRLTIGDTRVYADAPVDRAAMTIVLQRADARVATSPLHTGAVGTRVFLTDGGWRWRVLSLTSPDALGLTRPWSDLVSDAVILNRSDARRDRIATRFGGRRLSGVIAHERTHIMVRRHLGPVEGLMLPRWIGEGYADHVAGESTLNSMQAAQLRRHGSDHPALFYFDSRRRVEAALAASGGNVDALFEMQ